MFNNIICAKNISISILGICLLNYFNIISILTLLVCMILYYIIAKLVYKY